MGRKYRNFKKKVTGRKASMRGKITLSLLAIAVVLLLASTISVLEYRRMSNYVTDRISSNIRCINVSEKLSKMCEDHNLRVLNAIGEDGLTMDLMPELDEDLFMAECDSISLTLGDASALIDSVKASYYAYIRSSDRLMAVIGSDFVNTRDWYFTGLEPKYDRLRDDISKVSEAAYGELQTNSETFQASFYRSIIPGMVASAVGLLLVLLLLFFLSSYYVNPVYRMLKNLKASILSGTKYRYTFEGNDQLAELNESITEVVEENVEMRRRVRALAEENESLKEAVSSTEE